MGRAAINVEMETDQVPLLVSSSISSERAKHK